MKNRTIYDVLEKVMQDYTYTLTKTGNKVEVTGKVYISRIDYEVTHTKTIYLNDPSKTNGLETAIASFKTELKKKVAEVIKSHADELTDDEEMIDKLQYEMKELKSILAKTETELKEAKDRIAQLELEKINTSPWVNPTPWATGITWNTSGGTGTPPNEWHYEVTCEEKNSPYSCSWEREYEDLKSKIKHKYLGVEDGDVYD